MQNQKLPSIFEFETFAEYFAHFVQFKKSSHPSYSYSVLCRQIGGVSNSLLTQIGLGTRFPSANLLLKMKKVFQWNKKEFEFATALVAFSKAKSSEESAYHSELIRSLKPANQNLIRQLDEFDFFARWQNVVILSLVSHKDFNSKYKWIADRLNNEFTVQQIEESIKLLERLKLIKIDSKSGEITPENSAHMETPLNFPSKAVRSFHKTMLEKASDAINAQSINERFFCGTSMTIDGKRVKEAQTYLNEFRQKFIEEFYCDKGDKTYHFAMQYFKLTD